MMSTILSATAIACCLALFVRAVTLVDGMDRKARTGPYLQFLAFGLSHAAGLAVVVGCTLVILDGTARS